MENMFRFCSSFLFRHNYVIYFFDVVTIFDDVRIKFILVRSNYVWKWLENYISCLFAIVTYFLFRCNYVIYLFVVVVTFFDDIRNRYYFATFELRMKITLQLRFISSNINEVIRTILNFFFFYEKILHA